MRNRVEPTSPNAPANRDTVHDLRNLFGIVSSAGHLLARQPSDTVRPQLLDAIEGAAIRGGLLTTDLLASPRPGVRKTFDANVRIAKLEPMLRALSEQSGNIRLELDDVPLMVRLDASAFDAAMLELVTNATKAGARQIILRSLLAGCSARFLVADNGNGMSAAAVQSALRGSLAGAHGSGLRRVLNFARDCHGGLRVRSSEHRGTVVSMTLPVVLSAAATRATLSPAPFLPANRDPAEQALSASG